MSPPVVVRNTQAKYFYGIAGGVSLVPVVLAMFTGQRWQVLGFIAVLWVLGARYVIPVSATVTDDGVAFRWPLRRVRVTAASLRRLAPSPSAASRKTLSLWATGAAPFNVTLSQYAAPATLATALRRVVEASGLTPEQQRLGVSALTRTP